MKVYEHVSKPGQWFVIAKGRYWARIQRVEGGLSRLVELEKLRELKHEDFSSGGRIVAHYKLTTVLVLKAALFEAEVYFVESDRRILVSMDKILDFREEHEVDGTFGKPILEVPLELVGLVGSSG